MLSGVEASLSLTDQVPLLLAGDDVFGQVFIAGMSIAAAGIGTTVFAGLLVSGRYDETEESFFDTQDSELQQSTADAVASSTKDFFGNVDPQPPSDIVTAKDGVDQSAA
jgi:hypothetical protein